MQRDGGPGGAGGAGNPVGGGFTGPAENIELVGDHFYSYSGPVTNVGTGSADTTTNRFRTGNYYCVGQIMWANNQQGADAIYFDVYMNEAKIIQLQWDGSPALESNPPFNIVIPAFTEVEAKWGIASGSKQMCILFTGRIYRG